MKVSVVILNWNGCDMLRTFLPSVVRYSKGAGIEVCVADNGSTDDSVNMLHREFPSVRTILLEQNHGFADGDDDIDFYFDYFLKLSCNLLIKAHAINIKKGMTEGIKKGCRLRS